MIIPYLRYLNYSNMVNSRNNEIWIKSSVILLWKSKLKVEMLLAINICILDHFFNLHQPQRIYVLQYKQTVNIFLFNWHKRLLVFRVESTIPLNFPYRVNHFLVPICDWLVHNNPSSLWFFPCRVNIPSNFPYRVNHPFNFSVPSQPSQHSFRG